MGIMNEAQELFRIMGTDEFKNVSKSLNNAFGMASRGSEAIKPSTSETIFNGEHSLARKLFKSSHEGARWDNIVMNKGKEDEWRLSGRRVAGAFVGASALGRLASGGGIYKDADGNTDIIGIPFI